MREFTITVQVKPGARKREILYDDKRKILLVKTPKAPEDGKANKDVVDIVAEYYGVPKSAVSLTKGARSKTKIIKIMAL